MLNALKFLLQQALILLLIFTCSRGLVRLLPGDPAEAMLAESGSSLSVQALRAEFHLDLPFFPALWGDLRNAIHGDFGRSLVSKEPIGDILWDRMAATAMLVLTSLALALLISLPLGMLAAHRAGSFADRACTTLGAITSAIPSAWLGPVLILVFAVVIPIFPLGRHLALPAVSLAFQISGTWSRLVRNRVRDSLLIGASQGARARGLSETTVLWKYGLAPVASSLLGYLGMQIGFLMGGSILTEIIFDWPGMGSLLVDAVLKRDYPVVEAGVFLIAFFVLLGNLIGDALQYWSNPRLRSQEKFSP